MPSPIHGVLVELLAIHPEVLGYLLEIQGVLLPGSLVPTADTKVKTISIERRVDRVFLVGARDAPDAFVLLEVQLDADDDKRFAWPLYVELARSRYRCEGCLVVLTTTAEVRRWIERAIVPATGICGAERQLRPLVVALDEIDPSLLLRADRPYLAPLAVAARAEKPDLTEIAEAAVELTVEQLPERLATAQLDAILGMVNATLRSHLESTLMEHPRFKSETFRRWYAQAIAEGEAQGMAQGMAQGIEKGMAQGIEKGMAQGIEKGMAQGIEKGLAAGKAEDILAVLAARGIPVSESVRARILGCEDVATLDRWIQRAAVVSSAAAVVRSAKPSRPRKRPATPRRSKAS